MMEHTPQEYINSLTLEEFSLLVVQSDDLFQEMVFEVSLKLLQDKLPISELLDYIEYYQHVGCKAIIKHISRNKT